MKSARFILHIPEPCHEDWDRMLPDAKGKFCNACCKSVYDFSEKTPAEIRDILFQQPSGKICGYFKETQLNRPLSANPDKRLMNFTRRFAIALYLVFGSLLFSCKAVPEPEQKPHVNWKQDGPVFQKGRFTESEFHKDSTGIKYGPADYIYYLGEEATDTVLTREK